MYRLTLMSTLIYICAACCCLTSTAADDDAWWPDWQGPGREGKSTETGLLKQWPEGGPKQLWHATGLGSGFATVSVTAEGVYTIGQNGEDLHLFAFKHDGSLAWKIRVTQAYITRPGAARATPVVDGDRIYVEAGGGYLGCYKTKDGSLVWSSDLTSFGGRPHKWGYSESPLIYKNLCIVTPGGASAFVALDKMTGKEVWRSTGFSAPAHYSSPIAITFEGVTMIVNGTGAGIFAVSPKDGSLIWSNNFCAGNTANCPGARFSDPYVFWANGYGKGGICLKLAKEGDKITATEVWRSRDIDNHHGGYIIKDGYIYGHNKNTWTCLKLTTGEVMWSDRGVGKGSVTYADGMLYTFSERGGIIGLVEATPDGYKEHGRFQVAGTEQSWAHPVVAHGCLYLRYADNLYCFDIRAK